MTNVDSFNVADEVVLITGVSGQLGRSYARSFLERGAQVIGIDLERNQVVDGISSEYPNRFRFCTADVTVKEDLEKAASGAAGAFGPPTVLVNNAALDSPPSAPLEENGPFESYPESSWDKVLDVNVKGVYLCCQVFGALMAKHGRGSIINISSVYGMLSPDQSLYEYRRQRGEQFYKPVAYSVSKSAVLNLTRYLAIYWARKGVRVNSLTIAGVYNHQDEEFLRAYCSRIPIGRMAEEGEYDGPVLFLASAASRYMTGANLIVDGGWTAI